MLSTNLPPDSQTLEEINTSPTIPLTFVVQPDIKLYKLLANLSADARWAVRKDAAQKLGKNGSPEALQGLLDALPKDPFWMVRCTIIQALERSSDRRVIPLLREVAQSDGFQVVRSYAARAIERLS